MSHSLDEMYTLAGNVWDAVQALSTQEGARMETLLQRAATTPAISKRTAGTYAEALENLGYIRNAITSMQEQMAVQFREPYDSENDRLHFQLGLIGNYTGTLRLSESVAKVLRALSTDGADLGMLAAVENYSETLHNIARCTDELLNDPEHITSVLQSQLLKELTHYTDKEGKVHTVGMGQQLFEHQFQANLVIEQDKWNQKVKREREMAFAPDDAARAAIEKRPITSALTEVPNALDWLLRSAERLENAGEFATGRMKQELFHGQPRVHVATGQLPPRELWGKGFKELVPKMDRTIAGILRDPSGMIASTLIEMMHPAPSTGTDANVKNMIKQNYAEHAEKLYEFLSRVQPLFAVADAAHRTVMHIEEVATR